MDADQKEKRKKITAGDGDPYSEELGTIHSLEDWVKMRDVSSATSSSRGGVTQSPLALRGMAVGVEQGFLHHFLITIFNRMHLASVFIFVIKPKPDARQLLKYLKIF